MKCLRIFVIVVLMSAIVATVSAQPKTGFLGWGPRGGITFDPDQIHFGAHLDFGNFFKRVRFQPNSDIGFGDDVTVATVNLELAYRLGTRWSAWTPYLGAGPAFAYYRIDAPGDDDSESDGGLNLIAGIERGLSRGNRLSLQSTFGIGDLPELKLTLGWTFAGKSD